MICIVDYGSGNIRAITNIYDRLSIRCRVARRPEELNDATKLLLPGVGAFDHTMQQLENSGVRPKLEELVHGKKVLILGICVGMQILGRGSEEGSLPGLSWVNGTVRKLDTSAINGSTLLPHMGWNDVQPFGETSLFQGLHSAVPFYFLHSYYFACDSQSDVIATTEYGVSFASAIRKANIYGVQFHPEKSHRQGVELLKNFANL